MDGAGGRGKQHVVHPLPADLIGEGDDLPEVVGEQVLGGHVVHPPGQLEHVAGGERRQHHLPHPGVVVEPVPGLARAPVGLLVRLHHRAVRLPDPGPLHPHVLTPGHVADGVGPEALHPTGRVHLGHDLEVGRGEAGREDARHLGLGEDRDVLVGPARGRLPGERRGIDQVRGLEAFPPGLELADQLLQLRGLGLQLERLLQLDERVAPAPFPQELPPAPLVHLRLVGREASCVVVIGLGRIGAPVGGEQVGAPQPEQGISGREPDGVAEELEGAVDVTALEEQGGERAAGLRVVMSHRQDLPVPAHGVLDPREPPGDAGGSIGRAGQAGHLLGQPEEFELRARRIAHRLPRLGERAAGCRPPGPVGGDRLQLAHRLLGASVADLLLGERQPRDRVGRVGPQRRLEPLPSAVRVQVLEPGREKLGLGVARKEVGGAAGFPARRVLTRVLRELLAEGRREIHAGLALCRAARPRSTARQRRHERFHADGSWRGTGGERRSWRHRRRPGVDGLADQVGEAQRQRHLALVLGKLHQDPVRALAQRDLDCGLVEPRRVVGGLDEHLRSIHPDAKGAAGADPEPGPLLAGHLGNGQSVDHRLPLRPHRRADGEDAAELQLGRQGAPAHLARLAGKAGAEVDRNLGRKLALEASSPLVVEGPGDPPSPDEPEPFPLRIGPVRIAARFLYRGEKPARQRPDLRMRPGIARDGPVGRCRAREVGERRLELSDSHQRSDGARLGVALAEVGCGGLECGDGGVAVRGPGGGRPCGEERQGEEKGGERHARSLPPERPANSADRSGHSVLSLGPGQRHHGDAAGTRLPERLARGLGGGSGGHDVVHEHQVEPGHRLRGGKGALGRCWPARRGRAPPAAGSRGPGASRREGTATPRRGRRTPRAAWPGRSPSGSGAGAREEPRPRGLPGEPRPARPASAPAGRRPRRGRRT